MKCKIDEVVDFVKVDEEDNLDALFWHGKSAAERLAEITRLRKNYFI